MARKSGGTKVGNILRSIVGRKAPEPTPAPPKQVMVGGYMGGIERHKLPSGVAPPPRTIDRIGGYAGGIEAHRLPSGEVPPPRTEITGVYLGGAERHITPSGVLPPPSTRQLRAGTQREVGRAEDIGRERKIGREERKTERERIREIKREIRRGTFQPPPSVIGVSAKDTKAKFYHFALAEAYERKTGKEARREVWKNILSDIKKLPAQINIGVGVGEKKPKLKGKWFAPFEKTGITEQEKRAKELELAKDIKVDFYGKGTISTTKTATSPTTIGELTAEQKIILDPYQKYAKLPPEKARDFLAADISKKIDVQIQSSDKFKNLANTYQTKIDAGENYEQVVKEYNQKAEEVYKEEFNKQFKKEYSKSSIQLERYYKTFGTPERVGKETAKILEFGVSSIPYMLPGGLGRGALVFMGVTKVAGGKTTAGALDIGLSLLPGFRQFRRMERGFVKEEFGALAKQEIKFIDVQLKGKGREYFFRAKGLQQLGKLKTDIDVYGTLKTVGKKGFRIEKAEAVSTTTGELAWAIKGGAYPSKIIGSAGYDVGGKGFSFKLPSSIKEEATKRYGEEISKRLSGFLVKGVSEPKISFGAIYSKPLMKKAKVIQMGWIKKPITKIKKISRRISPKEYAEKLHREEKLIFKIGELGERTLGRYLPPLEKRTPEILISEKLVKYTSRTKNTLLIQQTIAHELIHFKTIPKIRKILPPRIEKKIPYRLQPSEIIAHGLEKRYARIGFKIYEKKPVTTLQKKLVVKTAEVDKPTKEFKSVQKQFVKSLEVGGTIEIDIRTGLTLPLKKNIYYYFSKGKPDIRGLTFITKKKPIPTFEITGEPPTPTPREKPLFTFWKEFERKTPFEKTFGTPTTQVLEKPKPIIQTISPKTKAMLEVQRKEVSERIAKKTPEIFEPLLKTERGKELPFMVGGAGLRQLPKPSYAPVEFGIEVTPFAKPEIKITLKPKERVTTIQPPKLPSKEKFKEALTQPSKEVLKEKLFQPQPEKFKERLKEALKTRQIQKQKLQLRTTPRIPKIPTLKIPPPKIPFPKFKGLPIKISALKKDIGLYEVFTRKFGKEVSLGKFFEKEKAKQKLRATLKGGLEASGIITKDKKKLSFEEIGLGDLEFAPSKLEFGRVIQKKEKRLGTRPETKELHFFKRKGGKSRKWLNI